MSTIDVLTNAVLLCDIHMALALLPVLATLTTLATLALGYRQRAAMLASMAIAMTAPDVITPDMITHDRIRTRTASVEPVIIDLQSWSSVMTSGAVLLTDSRSCRLLTAGSSPVLQPNGWTSTGKRPGARLASHL